MDTEDSNNIKDELYYRELFVSNPDHPELNNPYLLLHNVFEHHALYNYQPLNEEEAQMLTLLKSQEPLFNINTPSIVPRDEFIRRWNVFTLNIFDGMNWDNIVCAGGAVLNCLSTLPFSRESKDIDLFIMSTSKAMAYMALNEIWSTIQRNYKGKHILIGVNEICIRFLLDPPYKEIQVMTQLYRSPSHLLLGFDVDACTSMFDGSNVFATERFHRALTKGYNLADPTRRSGTYEDRLYRYSVKGFFVLVPIASENIIDKDIEYDLFELDGLTKLLKYHQLSNTDQDKLLQRAEENAYIAGHTTFSTCFFFHQALKRVFWKDEMSKTWHYVDTNGKKLLTNNFFDDTYGGMEWMNLHHYNMLKQSGAIIH